MFNRNHVVLLGIDLWEHGKKKNVFFLLKIFSIAAYYPVYENRRQEYVDNFWRIVNWPYVAQLYSEGKAQRSDL